MTLSVDDHRLSLNRFAARVPDLLNRHGATSALARDFEALDLRAELARRNFSLAIVGRMKAGKSTLLNALVGMSIAPVGMNETTATVNWIERGDATSAFEILWRDAERPPEMRSIDRLEELIGRSAEASLVDHLRFECPSAFLDGVRLIDAPGTMSTIDSHEAHTADLVTRRYGEHADAVILALPTMVGQRDAELMENFAEQTRFPGQGAYNTVAVMQKWEALDDPVPEEAARSLAANFRHRLQHHVADVLPVSGLLSIFAREASDDDLETLIHLTERSEPSSLKGLLKIETRFFEESDGVALSVAGRMSLLTSLRTALLGPNVGRAAGTFEAMRFAIRLVERRGLRSCAALRTELQDVSGIDRLRALLEQRFFATASLIKSGTILRKALEPCKAASIRLRAGQSGRERLIARAEALLASSKTPNIEDLRDQVATTLDLLKEERDPIDDTARELEALAASAERDFRMLMDDIGYLHALADDDGLSPALQQAARQLFGQFGHERTARLGLGPSATTLEQHRAAHRLLQDLLLAAQRSRIARHAETRVNLILDQLDTELVG